MEKDDLKRSRLRNKMEQNKAWRKGKGWENEIYSFLECPMCKKLLTGEIQQCSDGHVTCEQCRYAAEVKVKVIH